MCIIHVYIQLLIAIANVCINVFSTHIGKDLSPDAMADFCCYLFCQCCHFNDIAQ